MTATAVMTGMVVGDAKPTVDRTRRVGAGPRTRVRVDRTMSARVGETAVAGVTVTVVRPTAGRIR
ncbi:MAG: hypothetical protein MK177_08740 [Acidimicrobiales bacterium]|nr:hypothetical protein [Acidimicrobiales bacterium]